MWRKCITALVLVGASALPLVAPAASAAPAPASQSCGFQLASPVLQGAAGHEYYSVDALPAVPGQVCSVLVHVSTRVVPAAGGSYTQPAPASGLLPLRYLPGLYTPMIAVDWVGHCADPAAPGVLSLTVGNQTVSTPVAAQSCATSAAPISTLSVYLLAPTGLAVARSGSAGEYQILTDRQIGIFTPSGARYPYINDPPPDSSAIALATTTDGKGSWVAGANGAVFAYGTSAFKGSAYGLPLVAPVVGMAARPTADGYWLAASDGGVFSFGAAHFYGSLGGVRLIAPIMGMAGTPTGAGYWMVASDGGVFAFGDAHFHGSLGGIHLAAPIVAMAVTPDGGGYWLVGSDGGVFAFGDAHFFGSTAGIRLAAPVESVASTVDGRGYWMVAADGGVFNYGDAPLYHP
jgi:hypothetical protein